MILNLVVPCYNEEPVLPETATRLVALMDRLIGDGAISDQSGIYFIDDGSRDRTWDVILGVRAARPDRVHGIKLARNCGHQAALLAGLRNVPGEALISIDADLQDDIEVIPAMIEEWKLGHDIVYGVRSGRKADTFFKRHTARGYYRLLGMLGVNIVLDHADFRLMSRRALTALERYPEVNIFLRALVPLLGFKTTSVYYDRAPRFAGVSKYPLGRMISLALDGITSFSMRPLRLIAYAGGIMSLFSFLIGAWALYIVLLTNRGVPGWASIVVPIAFVGGLQLASLGVIGEYIGKIYMEVKRRPLFEIEEIN
ncbi:MAG TPA: glycosyltransferase [Acetobacteraceae bacterium]|nr:glycosyltransferase [Acetobacteraceae bacterium]